MRFSAWLPLLVLMFVLVACGSGGTTSPAEDSWFAPDIITWRTPDGASKDTVIPADLNTPPTDTAAADIPTPQDTSQPTDSLPETGGQDVKQDTSQDTGVDLPQELLDTDPGPCGGCPDDKPNCIDGQCLCTPFSCTDGNYCKGGDCVDCTVDAHCGPDCVSCSSLSQFCAADGESCVDCDQANPCPAFKHCVENLCVDCLDDGLCGPDCIECTGEKPLCQDDVCVCSADSCGLNASCDDGECVGCTSTDPQHCGPDCLVCSGGSPHCLDGQCILCNTADQCGPSCAPCQAGKPYCPPGGEHCVTCLDDGHCPPGQVCQDNECVPDCQALGCLTDLGEDGEACSDAFVVGRVAASQTAHFDGDTWNDGDDDDLNYFFGHSDCWDAADDNFYWIYLLPGETIQVHLTVGDSDFDAMLKLYKGTECDEDDAGFFDDNDADLISCTDNEDDGEDESFSWVAPTEGWFTIVVDGRQSGEDADWGTYGLDITLTCSTENCCCNGYDLLPGSNRRHSQEGKASGR